MIGIAITTHNRAHVLEYALRHFMTFKPKPFSSYKIIVCDDASNEHQHQLNLKVCQKHGVTYIHSDKRLGIAKNKNVGIRYLRHIGVDDYFLFDDDCMPIADDWDIPFRELALRGCEHSMHLVAAGPEVKVEEFASDRTIWNNAGGYCLYFTRRAMDTLGGMDERFGIYGFEHAEITRRAARLGFCGSHQYVSPRDSGNWIYSLDMDLGWLQKQSPLGPINDFHSSVADELEKVPTWVQENRKIYLSNP